MNEEKIFWRIFIEIVKDNHYKLDKGEAQLKVCCGENIPYVPTDVDNSNNKKVVSSTTTTTTTKSLISAEKQEQLKQQQIQDDNNNNPKSINQR